MMDFSTKPLSEFVRLSSGGTPAKSNSSYWGGTIPWLTPKDMSQFDGSTQDSVTDAAIGNGTRLAPIESLFIVVRGMSLHNEIRVVRPMKPMSFNQDIKAILAKEGVNERFIYYAIQAKVPELLSAVEAAGHGTGRLPTDRLEGLQIPDLLPHEQCAIASTFGALDDKIELNRRMNETLEAMVGAIFKDWFVNFGPTRAKMEGRAPYLASETWDLFPDKLDDEGKPEGWGIFKLDQIADYCKGSVSPSNDPEEVFEHYSIPAFDKGEQPSIDIGQSIKSNKTPVPADVVLLSKLNPEKSRVWIPNPPSGTVQVTSTEFLVYRPKSAVGRGGLYSLFKSDSFKKMLEGMVTGTSKSHQRISPPALLKSDVITGAASLFEEFESVVAPLIERSLSNRSEKMTLDRTRDLLLPRLMSGVIRVTDAQELAEEVI